MLRAVCMSADRENISPEWKAPEEDGRILLWPDPASLCAQTRRNHESLAKASARIQNIPANELRAMARRWMGHDDTQLLIATGHQVELIHPGVWAKDVLINALARKLSGAAAHFAVDTDAPKHLQLRFPGGSAPITDDRRLTSAAWCGLLAPPSPAHLKHIEMEFSRAAGSWPFHSMLGALLSCLRRAIVDADDLPTPLTNAVHQLDWSLGLRHHLFLASPIWQSRTFLAFAHHILARAESFAHSYNSALAEYRRENGVRDAGRPWPDLRMEADCIEVPFWVDELEGGVRQRACVGRVDDRLVLRIAPAAEFPLEANADGMTAADELARFLSANRVRLSPRALTLTASIRLFIADQFVHGIGGGLYDRITDRIISSWFGIAPPSFSVTTATLLFPTAVMQRRIDLRTLLMEGRRIRHGDADPRKMELVRAIAGAPRKSPQRGEFFQQLHRFLAEQLEAPAYKQWQIRLEDARNAAQEQAELFDRELFYAIQPESRLQALISHYESLLS